jgi:hypothetical protein
MELLYLAPASAKIFFPPYIAQSPFVLKVFCGIEYKISMLLPTFLEPTQTPNDLKKQSKCKYAPF